MRVIQYQYPSSWVYTIYSNNQVDEHKYLHSNVEEGDWVKVEGLQQENQLSIKFGIFNNKKSAKHQF